jgi:adenylate cyclase
MSSDVTDLPEQPERLKRRLAAVLVADIAGYSRLMQRDEAGTHTRWQAHLAAAEDLVSTHGGRWVKTTGDGFIAEFPSLADTLDAALAIQDHIVSQEQAVPPDLRLRLRIGLHLGDLLVGGPDDTDLFGDGLNIAARLEPLAPPGGICVADATRLALKGKADVFFTPAGTRRLKNIDEPVRLWTVSRGPRRRTARRLPVPRRTAAVVLALAAGAGVIAFELAKQPPVTPPLPAAAEPPSLGHASRKLSIVVLPFANQSNDPANDVYADAITEDLVTDLSRIADAFVISSNTSFTFRGQTIDVRAVAKQLDVNYAVVGSVRPDGESLGISASLIDARTGGVLWSQRYTRTRTDMHAFQQEVTGQIARILNLKVKQAASDRASRQAPRDLDAQDYALRAWTEIWNKPQSAETNAAGLAFADKALAIDPANSDALATRAYALARASFSGWSDRPHDELVRDAVADGERAVALDPNNADALYALHIALRVAGNIDRAELMLRAAIAANQNHAPAYGALGFLDILKGKPALAHAFHQKALEISPLDPLRGAWYQQDSFAYLLEGKDAEALQAAERAEAANPVLSSAYLDAALALEGLGRRQEAMAAMQQHDSLRPGWTVEKLKAANVVTDGTPQARLYQPVFDRLHALGIPER